MSDIRNTPLPAIKEELGGDYYYRCPVRKCGEIIKSSWRYCPSCGQRIQQEEDEYTLRAIH
jgi:rubrerythrin